MGEPAKYRTRSYNIRRSGKKPRELAKHDTERGHSPELKKNLHALEERIRNEVDEQLHMFDDNGKEVHWVQGKGPEVKLSLYDLNAMKDKVVTHNHPRSIGKEGFGGIGHSFSGADFATFVNGNAKEFRAATPTFTFSIKRPAKGWGATPDEVRAYVDKTRVELKREIYSIDSKVENNAMRKHGEKGLMAVSRLDDERRERKNVYFYTELSRRVAKHFGWDYTRKQHHSAQKKGRQ